MHASGPLGNLRAINIEQSDTTTYGVSADDGQSIKLLQVFAVNGTIKIHNGVADITYTIPAVASGGVCPFFIPGPIHKIYDTDTSIDNAALIGYV